MEFPWQPKAFAEDYLRKYGDIVAYSAQFLLLRWIQEHKVITQKAQGKFSLMAPWQF